MAGAAPCAGWKKNSAAVAELPALDLSLVLTFARGSRISTDQAAPPKPFSPKCVWEPKLDLFLSLKSKTVLRNAKAQSFKETLLGKLGRNKTCRTRISLHSKQALELRPNEIVK